jgi:predicted SAM-dependent methyltransferase
MTAWVARRTDEIINEVADLEAQIKNYQWIARYLMHQHERALLTEDIDLENWAIVRAAEMEEGIRAGKLKMVKLRQELLGLLEAQ